MPPPLLTSAEVAIRFGVSPRTVHRLVRDGKLEPAQTIAIGRHGSYLFRPIDVDRLAKRRQRGAA